MEPGPILAQPRRANHLQYRAIRQTQTNLTPASGARTARRLCPQHRRSSRAPRSLTSCLALRSPAHTTPSRPPHPALHVRDDRDTPLVVEAGVNQNSEAKLKGFFARRANRPNRSAVVFSPCAGDVRSSGGFPLGQVGMSQPANSGHSYLHRAANEALYQFSYEKRRFLYEGPGNDLAPDRVDLTTSWKCRMMIYQV